MPFFDLQAREPSTLHSTPSPACILCAILSSSVGGTGFSALPMLCFSSSKMEVVGSEGLEEGELIPASSPFFKSSKKLADGA
eukprot:CAMPEP_0181187412 /NCGR_PEP_ID=MMETSP1096-20121128/10557_1 /TAXON_ID=156174 ORGANISM="Chrysochromulina ericina, Strain CCMP281" /NCGR_SAMPLE_ID=MMETSP1096 /ASSEMBLY_ACC=CAM_ASM_000453 /LENGTH=81 /DNA_ID=CAMNT_0023276381 /DNA_START=284 /DNA_END=525 /DNA_ORIENTATION=+